MTEAQAVEAILEAWKPAWALLHPSDCPVVYDNTTLTAPTTWGRLTIVHTVRNQISMGPKGSRRFQSKGRIAVQLFGDVNRGRAQVSGLADDVRAVLESIALVVTGQPLCTYGATTNEQKTDGRWFSSLVLVPFDYYDIR